MATSSRLDRALRIDGATRIDRALRVVTAILGTLPLSVLATACLARFLPGAPELRFALAFGLAIPLWVTAMCASFLARSGARAALTCALVTVALAALAYGVPA